MIKLTTVLLIAVLVASGCVSQSQDQPVAQPASEQPPQPTGQPEPPPAGGLGGSTVAVKTFRIVIGHTFYNPSTLTVSKGDVIRLLANAASGTGDESGFSHNHGITIDEYGINQAVTIEDAGKPVVVEFTADKAGSFRIYCKTCEDGPFGKGHPPIQATLVVNG